MPGPTWPHAPAPADPMELFAAWFRQAQEREVPGPRAMVLATVAPTGLPSQRVVILRDFSTNGLVFVSSAMSRKGVELARNAQAGAHFHWPALQRQISVAGAVEVLTPQVSDALFQERSPRAKAVAVGSEQSAPLLDAGDLHRHVEALAAHGSNLPRPATQVGYVLKPTAVEFWAGNDDELHNRLRFDQLNGRWNSVLLQP
ncbi:MAG: pyridoxal 5'-phosphate synthase [Kocuria sp.]|nr:pyridoxal 5'-phosphate synthase [Kocuria sp.]MDO5619221.1 pyridoxal 5'-phosphate synthase [Kocuria sp.]